jgi:putative flippase GtrA
VTEIEHAPGVGGHLARHLRRFIHYSGVSVVSLSVGQLLLLGLNSGLGVSPWFANTVAVTLSAVPAYLLYRYVVWAKRTANDIRREVVPFWLMALVGLVLSTVAVDLVDGWWGTAVAVNLAYLASFGALWVFKYLVLEHWMFGVQPSPARVTAGPEQL